jgi:NADPH-dependent F420 reductase
MKLAIIGAGAVGAELAKGWSSAGHDVVFGVRDPGKAAVRALCESLGATASLPAAAAADGDVVVIALPWEAAEPVLSSLGDLSGKTVIDCTNPLRFEDGELSLDRGYTTSGGEQLAEWLPGANVVKAMNHVSAEMMSAADTLEGTPVMFIAGDDADARTLVAGLVEDLGFEAMDAGGLRQSRLLEPLAMVFINQAMFRGLGREWAFGVLRPTSD